MFKNKNNNHMKNFGNEMKGDITSEFEIFVDQNYFTTEDDYLMNEEMFINEIRFFTIIDHFDSTTLSIAMLTKDNWLKDIVQLFSKGQAFNYTK